MKNSSDPTIFIKPRGSVKFTAKDEFSRVAAYIHKDANVADISKILGEIFIITHPSDDQATFGDLQHNIMYRAKSKL